MSLPLRELHRRFWGREVVERPLTGLSREGSFFLQPFLDLGVRDGSLLPGDVPRPDDFLETYFRRVLRDDPLDGDLYWVLKPPRALPWMEAIIGCGVHVSALSGSMTAVAPETPPDIDRVDLGSSEWLRLMTDFTRTLSGHFGGRFPVGQTLMRGPSDMLAALLGLRFYTELVDNPARMRALARQCADLWIAVLREQYRSITPFDGGQVSGIMGVWAPGPVAVFQEDAAGFISRRMYHEVFWECDVAIAEAFPFTMLHLHSAALQMLPDVLEIPGLSAVNVVVDPGGPPLQDLLLQLRSVQESGKALHLHGDLSDADISRVRGTLSSNGLCVALVKGS